MSDVSDVHGPMNLIIRKDTKSAIKNHNFKFSTEGSNKYIENHYHPVKFTGKKGQVMIARTNDCFHRASIPENGRTRDILTFYLTTSSFQRTQSEMFKNSNHEQYYGLKRLFLQ